MRMPLTSFNLFPVSYTHLDVYKRQEDQVYTAKTGNDGCYEIPDVKIGTGYEVTASKEGYKLSLIHI